jgi:O-antigen/teichoic acid export membrane protein
MLPPVPPPQGDAAQPGGSSPKAALGRSMGANALGQMAFVVSGFVVPRLLNDHIGTEMLGVWDLGWSMVSHLMLVGAGMMSAVSREVARFPATRDVEALRSVVSTCYALFTALGVVVALLSVVFAALLPYVVPSLSPELLWEARVVLILLGAGTGLRFGVHVFNGIITGLQRFVAHNVIIAGCYLGGVALGVALVLSGFGLWAMAAANVLGEVAAGFLKAAYARRICPEWRIALRDIRWSTLAHVMHFGGKTLLSTVSRVLLYQTNTILVGRFLGIEALAIFSRSRSLVLLLDTLVQRVVSIFLSLASELDARGDRTGLRRTLYQATEVSLFTVLPGVLALILLGQPILEMWMGPQFAMGLLLTVLAAGHLGMLSMRGTINVLIGMGRHGWSSLIDVTAAIAAISLSALLLGPAQMGLLGAALAIVIPLTIASWILLPMYACRVLEVRLGPFFYRTLRRPLLAVTPAAAIFLLSRWVDIPHPGVRVALALGLGGLVYGFLCAGFLLNGQERAQLLAWLRLPPLAPRKNAPGAG